MDPNFGKPKKFYTKNLFIDLNILKQKFFLELVFVFGIKISEQKIFLKCKFVLDWHQGLTKLEFDTEDQVLSILFSFCQAQPQPQL